MRKTYHAYLLIAPLMAGCLLFYIIPFVLILRHSFLRGSGQSAEFLGLDNYIEVIGSEAFALAFGNSMKFLAVGLPLIMLLSYLIALLLQHQVDRHKLLKSVFLFPYIMPVAGTVLLINLLFSETGLANGLLSALGLPVQQWLRGRTPFWVMTSCICGKAPATAQSCCWRALSRSRGEQYESADLDGASGWQKFCYITTPQMWYSVFFAAIFAVINAFKCFRGQIFLDRRRASGR